MNLYENLDQQIKAAGFNWSDVCKRANVSTGTPSHWKNGTSSATQRTYDKLKAALDEMIAERCEDMKKAGLIGKK